MRMDRDLKELATRIDAERPSGGGIDDDDVRRALIVPAKPDADLCNLQVAGGRARVAGAPRRSSRCLPQSWLPKDRRGLLMLGLICLVCVVIVPVAYGIASILHENIRAPDPKTPSPPPPPLP